MSPPFRSGFLHSVPMTKGPNTQIGKRQHGPSDIRMLATNKDGIAVRLVFLVDGRMQTICILIEITFSLSGWAETKAGLFLGNSWKSRGEDDHVYFWENMDFLRIKSQPNLLCGIIQTSVFKEGHMGMDTRLVGDGKQLEKSVPLNTRKCGQNKIQELIVTVNQATIPNQVGGIFVLHMMHGQK